MQRKFLILLAMAVALSLSCQQELDVEPTILLPPRILNVIPNRPKPGDVITIIGRKFGKPYSSNLIWVGSQSFAPDSGTSSRLFARIPWGYSSGLLAIKTPTDSILGHTVVVSPSCNLTNGSTVCFKFSPGATITDSSASVVDYNGQLQKWSVKVSADTITLTQYYSNRRKSEILKRIRFRHLGSGVQPLYLEGTWVNHDGGFSGDVESPITYVSFEPFRGYITIEQWNIPGVISGHVSIDVNRRWKDFNFYCEVK